MSKLMLFRPFASCWNCETKYDEGHVVDQARWWSGVIAHLAAKMTTDGPEDRGKKIKLDLMSTRNWGAGSS
jgi:hypothetical protein